MFWCSRQCPPPALHKHFVICGVFLISRCIYLLLRLLLTDANSMSAVQMRVIQYQGGLQSFLLRRLRFLSAVEQLTATSVSFAEVPLANLTFACHRPDPARKKVWYCVHFAKWAPSGTSLSLVLLRSCLKSPSNV